MLTPHTSRLCPRGLQALQTLQHLARNSRQELVHGRAARPLPPAGVAERRHTQVATRASLTSGSMRLDTSASKHAAMFAAAGEAGNALLVQKSVASVRRSNSRSQSASSRSTGFRHAPRGVLACTQRKVVVDRMPLLHEWLDEVLARRGEKIASAAAYPRRERRPAP